jgi:hypothetical protein
MPLFTKSALIAAVLAIPVFGTAIIGGNYQSVIVNHLVDIINAPNTQTVVTLNAPNWASGIPLAQPVGLAAATSTSGGTVASSTAFTFAVSAIDGTGTTTMSATAVATTDASTSPNEEIQVSWSAVTGATGYVVNFATSSNATAFSQYFYATSTNGVPNTYYTFATSTGSLGGSYARLNTTAFATKINPLGQSYLNGGGLQVLGQLAAGTSTPVADFTATNVAANATTTVQLGKTGQTKGTCVKLYRTDGSAIYAYVIAGATAFTLSTSANICSSITGF